LNIRFALPNLLFSSHLTYPSDFLTTRYLQQRLPVNRKSFAPPIYLRIVIGQQDRADLALLDRMYHVADAGYLCGDRQGCMKGTRREVLFQLEQWSKDDKDKRVFWLNGLAGTEKSTIAQTFAEMCFAGGDLGASFFCSRDFDDRSNLRSIFPTLAFQLAHRYPHFRQELLPVLAENPDVGRESLCSQMKKLIVGPFRAVGAPTIIIIDALDECRDKEPASALLSVLSRHVDDIPLVKFFITGRPEPRIHSGFRLESLQPHTDVLRLHEVEPSSVDNDIKLFLKTRFVEITKNRRDCDLAEDWPGPHNINILCKKAAGFFIYASTVVKFVASRHYPPDERLVLIISLPQDTSHEGRSGVDLLYTCVLEEAFHDVDSHDHELYSRFKSVVGAVILIFHPLSINTLSDLLRNCGTPSRISSALCTLHSLLLIPDGTEDPVRIFHKSFPDFLTDPGRCADIRFFIDPSTHHNEISLSCLSMMKERLKKNICNLDDHAALSQVKDLATQRTTYIGGSLEYACSFWAQHLAKVSSSKNGAEEVQRVVNEFFSTGFLFWVEVLVLMGKLDIGIYALNHIQQWCVLVSHISQVLARPMLISIQTGVPDKWTIDSKHFILENFDTIHKSPSQIYHSALTLCPSSSWVHQCYTPKFPPKVRVMVGPVEWGACTRTVFCNNNHTRTLAYWNNAIATGYPGDDITIFDALTGSQTIVLHGHGGSVYSLAFSSDGILLVSGSLDRTIKLWDVQTGGVIKTLYGHTESVLSVSISAGNTMIASGSADSTIRLWNIRTGECHIIEEHNSIFTSVSFSPTNSQLLLSASEDGTVQKWDTDGHQIGSSIAGFCIAFSPDGTQFVSCNRITVTIWNTDSGETVKEFPIAYDECHYCCFSSDGRLIACTANQNIYLWDITGPDPCCIKTLIGHTNRIFSLVFPSLTLISASEDKSIKFWDISTSPTNPSAPYTESTSLTSASIRAVSLQAKDGLAFSLDSAGVVRIWSVLTGFCKEFIETQAKGIHIGDIQLINGRLIIVGCKRDASQIIYIWDSGKGKPQTMNGTGYMPRGFRISEDGSRVFCVDNGWIQGWSIQTGVHMGKAPLGPKYPYLLDSLWINGSKVFVHCGGSSTLGWDFGTPGSTPVQISPTSSDRPHLEFISVTSDSNAGLIGIEDRVTRKVVFQLSGRKPLAAQWDGQYLICGYETGEIAILDFSPMLSQ